MTTYATRYILGSALMALSIAALFRVGEVIGNALEQKYLYDTFAVIQTVPAKPKTVTRTLSVYSDYYEGRTMSNGKKFRQSAATVASNDWPLGTRLFIAVGDRVIQVTVTDRMTKRFSGKRVDLSRKVWDYLSKGKKPGLIHGAKIEVLK